MGAPSTADGLEADGAGLHRLGGGSRDPLRLTVALASPDIATIELRHDRARSTRPPGVGGFYLFGITHGDPITYARPLDSDGQPGAGEPLLL